MRSLPRLISDNKLSAASTCFAMTAACTTFTARFVLLVTDTFAESPLMRSSRTVSSLPVSSKLDVRHEDVRSP